MACYSPLYAIPDMNPVTNRPYKTVNGKTKYKIVSGKNVTDLPDVLRVPCGKCIGCRLEYSRQWANRLMLELEYHDSAYFVTLTYNNEHAPVSYYPDPETGEALESLTLSVRDVQLFLKRLRKAFPDDKIRFFCSGEYGPQTFRPHYHMIIFGLHLDDLVPTRCSSLGFQYYTSDKLQRVWSVDAEPIGMIVVSPVTWETCAYTARYVTKKLTGEAGKVYADFGLKPPFSTMSRKPGIAHQWYVDHPDWIDREYINISTKQGGRKFRPPKYYERLLALDDPDEAEQRSAVRKAMALRAKALIEARTDLSYDDYLEVCGDKKERAVAALVRRDV